MLRRTPLPAIAVVALLTLLAVVLSACGESSLSAAELRSQAGAICHGTADAIDRIAVPNTPDQGARFLRRGLLRMGPELTRLKTLKPPKDLEPEYRQAIAMATRELNTISEHERRIRGGADVIETFRTLETALAPITQIENRAWQALQLPACVRR
ncbi:MAG: hypothetical protein JWQ48_3444 [Conexibacter sp.]|nr:hypothetical protein [Conexibacter sp.]